MGDLVPSHLGFEETSGSKPKQRTIRCVSEWSQLFAFYASIVTKKHSQHIPDLMGYQILIIEASNE